jgi:hypothetical protein
VSLTTSHNEPSTKRIHHNYLNTLGGTLVLAHAHTLVKLLFAEAATPSAALNYDLLVLARINFCYLCACIGARRRRRRREAFYANLCCDNFLIGLSLESEFISCTALALVSLKFPSERRTLRGCVNNRSERA